MRSTIIFLFVIILINGITNTTVSNLIIAGPQFIIVLYCIITNKLEKAIFWHFLFFITSFTYYTGEDAELQSNFTSLASYNYAKLKFIGPVSYSYLISIVLMAIVLLRNPVQKKKNYLFGEFSKLISYLMVPGFIIGLLGLAFGGYYLEGMVQYGSYILVIFIHALILLRIDNANLSGMFYKILTPLLALFPICTYILHQVDAQLVGTPAASFFSFLLVPALLYKKNAVFSFVGLFFLIYNSIIIGTSGKSLILLLIFVIITLVLAMKKQNRQRFPVRSKIIRVVMLTFIIAIPTVTALVAITYGGSSFTVSKIHQVTTLLDFITFQGSIEDIAPSPYVRVTSLINILYEGLSNPFTLFFGKGYGGFFMDHFNYFGHLDLSGGGFSEKALADGRFYTGHDTMVTVPMFNGLIGSFLLLRFVLISVKFSKNNYFLLSSIPFLLLTFYFDTLIGVSGVLFLYAGSIKLNYKNNT